jgi:PIN domain nuclease of toxin-antitoxin system
MRYVLDACAIISLIRKEEGCIQIRQTLEAEENICFIHSLNLCEVYTIACAVMAPFKPRYFSQT